MIEKKAIVADEKGLQSRMVSRLTKKAISYKSTISIIYNGRNADAKSLINVLALKVPSGKTIIISASGDDELLAVDELIELIRSVDKGEKLSE